jgi:hypothetical protein
MWFEYAFICSAMDAIDSTCPMCNNNIAEGDISLVNL